MSTQKKCLHCGEDIAVNPGGLWYHVDPKWEHSAEPAPETPEPTPEPEMRVINAAIDLRP